MSVAHLDIGKRARSPGPSAQSPSGVWRSFAALGRLPVINENMVVLLMIAIIDDDQIVREAIGDLVQSLGYEVAIFESAEQFLAAGRLAQTSCLITDVQLPGLIPLP
jgi:PleD family two-component response regulator